MGFRQPDRAGALRMNVDVDRYCRADDPELRDEGRCRHLGVPFEQRQVALAESRRLAQQQAAKNVKPNDSGTLRELAELRRRLSIASRRSSAPDCEALVEGPGQILPEFVARQTADTTKFRRAFDQVQAPPPATSASCSDSDRRDLGNRQRRNLGHDPAVGRRPRRA
jgi:hypothetical protein